MEFTPGWQGVLTALVAVAGIVGTIIAGALTNGAANRRAAADRKAAEDHAIRNREQDREDRREQHERDVADDERRRRRSVLEKMTQELQPLITESFSEIALPAEVRSGIHAQLAVLAVQCASRDLMDSVLELDGADVGTRAEAIGALASELTAAFESVGAPGHEVGHERLRTGQHEATRARRTSAETPTSEPI